MKTSIDGILYFFILSNPLISLALDGTTIRYYYITLPLVFILLFLRLYQIKKYKIMMLAILFVSAISIGLAIAKGGDYGKINNHLFNYLDCIFLYLLFSLPEKRDDFLKTIKRHNKEMIAMIALINATELYLIVTHRGYSYNYNWGGTFYHGTNSMPHTLAYLMIITVIYTIILSIIERNRIYCLFALVPLYCIFISGVRIALLPTGILLFIIIDVFISKRTKSKFIRFLKALIVCVIFVTLFYDKILSSNMIAKILKRHTTGVVTSGRLEVWVYLFNNFKKSAFNWIFGMGDQTVYTLNTLNPKYHSSIWAHSDFVQILVGKGLFCLVGYIYAIYVFCKSLISPKKYYGILMVIVIVGLAALNGFYSYRESMLGIPAITVLVYLLDEQWFKVSGK